MKVSDEMSSVAYCSFLETDTDRTNMYRLRFNAIASKAMRDWLGAYISKTQDYVILTPITSATEMLENKKAFTFYRKRENELFITVSALVNSNGYLSKRLFGKRYRIKRDGKGRIYICLNEEVEPDGRCKCK